MSEQQWWVIFNRNFGCLAAYGPKPVDACRWVRRLYQESALGGGLSPSAAVRFAQSYRVFAGHRDPLTEATARAVADAWMHGETADALRLLADARPVPSLVEQVAATA